MAQRPEWMNTKRPAHLTTRQPRPPRQPSNVSFNAVLWMTFSFTVLVFFMFA